MMFQVLGFGCQQSDSSNLKLGPVDFLPRGVSNMLLERNVPLQTESLNVA
jgi:hypothetical protein